MNKVVPIKSAHPLVPPGPAAEEVKKKFDVTISGFMASVEATSEEEAIKEAKAYGIHYCWFSAKAALLLWLTVALWATVACQDLNKYVYTVNYVCTGETWPVYTATVKAYGLGEAWTRIKAEGELVCGLANVNISTNIIADSPTPEAVK